ncbi:MAG: diaminobutyrate acetyltransferase [Gammaproteobacteria bacterium]|nr:diaminobutyrate acetyltransferase [Gammaproteobacteria bacterium]MDX5374232.1 diaminobutyrate acetyltransferase [Gammaproteobacteria bacterium]
MTITYRPPSKEDGKSIHQLIRDSKTLDLNSAYLYFLLADHFRDTCVVAERDGQLVGFVSAYRLPARPDTLFVWQIGVDASTRGQGVASAMLQEYEQRPFFREIRRIELTISPSNKASQALFKRWAERLGTTLETQPYLTEDHLGASHEPELLYSMNLK